MKRFRFFQVAMFGVAMMTPRRAQPSGDSAGRRLPCGRREIRLWLSAGDDGRNAGGRDSGLESWGVRRADQPVRSNQDLRQSRASGVYSFQ